MRHLIWAKGCHKHVHLFGLLRSQAHVNVVTMIQTNHKIHLILLKRQIIDLKCSLTKTKLQITIAKIALINSRRTTKKKLCLLWTMKNSKMCNTPAVICAKRVNTVLSEQINSHTHNLYKMKSETDKRNEKNTHTWRRSSESQCTELQWCCKNFCCCYCRCECIKQSAHELWMSKLMAT